jgi:hypothetical protein
VSIRFSEPVLDDDRVAKDAVAALAAYMRQPSGSNGLQPTPADAIMSRRG